MTDERFADAMAFFAITYGAEYSAKQQTMWRVQIERHNISDAEFDAALDKFLMTKESNFMPRTPGAVLCYVVDARQQAKIEGLPTVTEAAIEVRRKLDAYGPMPEYSHPLIRLAVESIGYSSLVRYDSVKLQEIFGYRYGELRKNYLEGGGEAIMQRIEAGKKPKQLTGGNVSSGNYREVAQEPPAPRGAPSNALQAMLARIGNLRVATK